MRPIESFFTLYLNATPEDQDLFSLEAAIGREVSIVACDRPALNIYTQDLKVVADARYWLNAMDAEIVEIAWSR